MTSPLSPGLVSCLLAVGCGTWGQAISGPEHVSGIVKSLANQKGIIMKWTTLSFKQLAAQKTLRMDPKYWIKRQASSSKRQATSLPQSGGKKNYEKENK